METCGREKCVFKKSQIETYVKRPYPKILMLNFTWNEADIPCTELLKVLLSFEDGLRMSHLYKMEWDARAINDKEYNLRAMVCFVGAHYLIFIRERTVPNESKLMIRSNQSTVKWKLFNDTQIQEFPEWAAVVEYCIDSKCLPTLLIME